MTLGRVLLLSALAHGALLLAPIPDPSSLVPPDAAPAPALVWMQIVTPARPAASLQPAAPAPVSVPAAPAPPAPARSASPAPPAPPAPSTGTKIRARAFPEARAHAAAVSPAVLGHPEAALLELPERDDAADGPAVPAGARAIPGPAAPGSLLPGPVAPGGQPSGPVSAPAPAFDARAYGEHIRRRIDAHKHYPARARRLGLEGVATVIVAVDGRGHLARAPRIARSSGVAALDDEALRMARAAAPFPPLAGADARPAPLVVHVPVRFSLAGAP